MSHDTVAFRVVGRGFESPRTRRPGLACTARSASRCRTIRPTGRGAGRKKQRAADIGVGAFFAALAGFAGGEIGNATKSQMQGAFADSAAGGGIVDATKDVDKYLTRTGDKARGKKPSAACATPAVERSRERLRATGPAPKPATRGASVEKLDEVRGAARRFAFAMRRREAAIRREPLSARGRLDRRTRCPSRRPDP